MMFIPQTKNIARLSSLVDGLSYFTGPNIQVLRRVRDLVK
jgi:hypothetical protein